jgi:excisionase family DNA binding protein
MQTSQVANPAAARLDPEPASNLWTADDLASYLRLTRRAVYALVASTNVPRVRIGVRLRFLPQAVQAWVKTQACVLPSPNLDGSGCPSMVSRGLRQSWRASVTNE